MRIILLVALFAIAGIAQSSDSAKFEHSGNFWFSQCDSAKSRDVSDCTFFVSGLIKGMIAQSGISGTKPVLCVPVGLTNQQALDIFNSYMIKHPSLRHHDASVIFFKAMSDAFPCKK